MERYEMKNSILAAGSLAVLGVSFATPSPAQQTTPTTSEPRWTMPYESKFWGYTGLSAGRSKLQADCPPGGATCDDKDTVWRLYGGGKFNDFLGAEIGLMHLGEFDRAGGSTKSRGGVDLAITAGVPIGSISSVFLKAGTAYNRTEVTGTGLQTGKENGWGPRYGIGAQASFTKNWAVRLDADRYRVQLPGAKENIDTFMIGAQYSFR
jgi:OmpA-OmpF porin, OOP family